MTDLDSGADLHDLMDRALTGVSTPTDRLREGALHQGRPLRRRRRVVTGIASMAVVAATAAVMVPIVGGDGPTPGTVATDPSPKPQPKAPDDFVAHPGWWDMPVSDMRTRLVGLLPADVEIASYARTNTEHGPGESSAWSGVFTGTLRNSAATGPGSIEIMLTELPQDPAALADVRTQHLSCDLSDWDLRDLTTPVHCELGDRRGGLPHQRTISFTNNGISYAEVRRWDGDGEIYAAVANSTQRKWGPPASAARPPLTVAELTAVAESPSWVSE
ncbi:hypothetical protein [Nocardioides sp. URHA0020]|uniref:hypothetical protein n=1 Tax=Nocardioides sp. URHA0020 TaxID=1380392 RepID=UPI00048EB693|nr:hypothetical protein [Nocardioides sp. URHA0020]